MKPVKIDFPTLETRCLMDESEFMGFGEFFPVHRKGYQSSYTAWDAKLKMNVTKSYEQPDEDSFYIFKNNNANILAVAHLDTVVSTDTNWTFQQAQLGHNNAKRNLLWNAQLDDRLGVYILMDLLPQHLGKFAFDILLTTDEESSNSTAADFVVPTGKEYNWIFQFDRRGTGAVLYGYEDKFWRDTVNEFLKVEQGTFSDICKLYDLGVKGLNVGTGYHSEHQELCYMDIDETQDQVTKFIQFFKQYKDVKFPHDPTITKQANNWYDDDQWWDGRTTSNYWKDSDRFPSTSTTNATRSYKRDSAINDYTDQEYAEIVKSMARYEDDGSYTPSDGSVIDTQATLSDRLDRLSVATYDIGLVSASDFKSSDPVSWIDLPAVEKVFTLFQYPEISSFPNQTEVYRNRITHHHAAYCKSCSTPYPLEDLVWTSDSTPICEDCLDLLPHGVTVYTKLPDIVSEIVDETYERPLTPSELRWVQEGGGLRVAKKVKLTFTGVPQTVNRCMCDFCLNAEWEQHLVEFNIPSASVGGESTRMCRTCFELYQQEGDTALLPSESSL